MQRDSKAEEISDKIMADKIPLELKINSLEKSMAMIVKAVQEMKAGMDKLEKRVNDKQNDEIQEILKAQKSLEEVIAANSDEIKRIDNEILMFQNDKAEADSNKKEDDKVENTAKKYSYFNRGHCKYKLECRFTHPEETCETYLGGKICYEKLC